MVQLQKDLKKIEGTGIQVVGISYDAVDVLAKFSEKKGITFPLLSDPESKTIIAYSLLNKEAKGKQTGIPYPGTYVLDKDGVVRAKLFREGPLARHGTDELMKASQEVK